MSGRELSVDSGTFAIVRSNEVYADLDADSADIRLLTAGIVTTDSLETSKITLGGTEITADAGEINKLDGVTATTTELNYVDVTAGAGTASKAMVLDGSRDINNVNNLTAAKFIGNVDGDSGDLRTFTSNAITANTVNATTINVTDAVNFEDNDKIVMGTGDDLEIYHNGTHSVIHDNGTGNLRLRAGNFDVRNAGDTEDMITATVDGAVTLFYDNSSKIATSSTGVTVTGTMAGNVDGDSGDLRTFTANSITANGITGPLTGNVTGNIDGDSGDLRTFTANSITANGITGPLTGNVTGNADTASALATARAIAVSGAVAGTVNFDGSAGVTIDVAADSDMTLTLAGDVTGSATFTKMGDASLTAAIAANTISSTELVSATTLNIVNAAGTTVKTIIGAGS